MNKKLLALAIAGAFVAPVAMADSSAVTIYGVFSMSVDAVDGGSGGTATATSDPAENRARVSSNTTWFGFKVKEDLGNGLDFHAQLETQINADTGGGIGFANTSGNRNNFVGFSGKSWGSLDFGKIDSPLKTSTGKLDMFGGGYYIADYRNVFVDGTTNVRADNSVLYTSPNLNGFQLKAQTAATQENGSNKSPEFYSVAGSYTNGPIFAVLAYEKNQKVVGAAGGSVFDTQGGITGNGGYNITSSVAGAEPDFSTWRAGVGYNFGAFKVGLAFQREELDIDATTGTYTITGNGQTVVSAVGASADFQRDTWHLSGAYQVTPSTEIAAQVTHADDVDVGGGLSSLNTGDTGATLWTLGAKHKLSKRTLVYGLYTRVNNDSASGYSLGGGSTGAGQAVTPAAAGEDPRAFSVGVVHTF